MRIYAPVNGVLIEAVEHLWATYSPASGETALINDESAAVLEVLESGPKSAATVTAVLAADSGIDAASLAGIVDACWPRLIEAGLARELRDDHTSPQ